MQALFVPLSSRQESRCNCETRVLNFWHRTAAYANRCALPILKPSRDHKSRSHLPVKSTFFLPDSFHLMMAHQTWLSNLSIAYSVPTRSHPRTFYRLIFPLLSLIFGSVSLVIDGKLHCPWLPRCMVYPTWLICSWPEGRTQTKTTIPFSLNRSHICWQPGRS